MKYPFRMCGRVVEVLHYQVYYIDERINEDGNTVRENVTVDFPTQEEAQIEANQTGGVIIELDTSAYEWMDGLEVADVPDTYAAALEVYQMGQEAWERKTAFEASKRAEQLRADLDFVMLIGGLT